MKTKNHWIIAWVICGIISWWILGNSGLLMWGVLVAIAELFLHSKHWGSRAVRHQMWYPAVWALFALVAYFSGHQIEGVVWALLLVGSMFIVDYSSPKSRKQRAKAKRKAAKQQQQQQEESTQ